MMHNLGIIRNGQVFYFNHYGAPVPFVHVLFPDRVPTDRDITKYLRLIPEKLYTDGGNLEWSMMAFTEAVPFVWSR